MITLTYVMQPMTDQDAAAIHDERARAVNAYNCHLHHLIRWAHFRREIRCAPESEHTLAEELRATPRTGRRPTPKCEVHCSGPLNARARLQNTVLRLPETDALGARLARLRQQWEHVDVTASGLARSDDDELQAAEARRTYRELRDAGTHYLTIDMAQDAAKQAVTTSMRENRGEIPDYNRARIRQFDDSRGRIGVEPSWLAWGQGDEWNEIAFAGTRWKVKPRQLHQRPLTAEQHARGAALGRLDKHLVTYGAAIRQVYCTVRRRSGAYHRRPRYWYMLHVVVDSQHATHSVDASRCVAGIDICWRREGEATRVAYVARDDGTHEAYTMPASVYRGLRYADDVRGRADDEIHRLRTLLGLHRMTSVRTVLERAGMSPCATPEVQDIGRHARHLYDLYDGLRTRHLAYRDEHYRAAQILPLLRQCHTIYVEDLDGRGISKLVASIRGAKGRGLRQLTSPLQSWLRVLQSEASKYACRVVEVPAAYTSQMCPDCRSLIEPAGAAREVICPSCGVVHDVDRMAARNLIDRGQEMDAAAAAQ